MLIKVYKKRIFILLQLSTHSTKIKDMPNIEGIKVFNAWFIDVKDATDILNFHQRIF